MACVGHLWRRVLKGPLKAKLGSLSDLCMEEYIGHEHFNGLEVNWLFLIVMDDLKKVTTLKPKILSSSHKLKGSVLITVTQL